MTTKLQVVLLPIQVPVGKFCWNYGNQVICHKFDNEGGYSTCYLKLDNGLLVNGKNGVLKPYNCLKLKVKNAN